MKNPLKPKHIGAGYLLRWHLIPRNRFFNIYLHKFIGNDDERSKHDHPWHSLSIRLSGVMREHYKPMDAVAIWVERTRIPPVICYRSTTFAHRLVLVGNKPCWTIFITGPVIRDWGFLCPKGWQHWSTILLKTVKQLEVVNEARKRLHRRRQLHLSGWRNNSNSSRDAWCGSLFGGVGVMNKLDEITKNMIIKPKMPKGAGWQFVGLSPKQYTLGYDGLAFYFPEQGIYVISAVEVASDEHDIDKGPEYHISISKNGGRCSRNEARFVTKCFDMQDAEEDNHVPGGFVRNFWRPVADKYVGHVCPCQKTETAIVEGDYVWRAAP